MGLLEILSCLPIARHLRDGAISFASRPMCPPISNRERVPIQENPLFRTLHFHTASSHFPFFAAVIDTEDFG